MATKRKVDHVDKEDSLTEFEEQLKQEEVVKQLAAEEQDGILESANLRRDPDGTLYEFDVVRQAWFPKIDDDFIAKYQMSYGCGNSTEAATSNAEHVSTVSSSTSQSDPDRVAYEAFFASRPEDINSPEYQEWYAQYYYYYSGAAQQSETSENGEGGSTAVQMEGKDVQGGADAGKNKTKGKKGAAAVTANTPKPEPAWFDIGQEKNTNVYVTGLPPDITDDEFNELMTKVGLVAYDPVLRKPKLKLYKNNDGTYKGDGRCCYIKEESVNLAMQIIDGTMIRGHQVSVERAKFELKGQYDPAKKKRKLTNKEKKKFKEKQEKLLGWQPEKLADERPKHERVVVIKHSFLPELFEKDPSLLTEISADLRQECAKFGDVRKVTIYDRHADGVATVTFKTPEEADLCVKATNGRWFDGRKLEAANWDGKTKYLVEETEDEMNARLQQWQSFLESSSKEEGETTKVKANSSVNNIIGEDGKTVGNTEMVLLAIGEKENCAANVSIATEQLVTGESAMEESATDASAASSTSDASAVCSSATNASGIDLRGTNASETDVSDAAVVS